MNPAIVPAPSAVLMRCMTVRPAIPGLPPASFPCIEPRSTGPERRAKMTEPASNQFVLLGARRFLPLFLVQFLGAFNDQVYQKAFVALITYRLADRAGMDVAMLGIIASALFILPFAVVSPTAGQIADRVDKAKMTRFVKAWEVAVMGLAVIGYHTQNIYFLYFVLFMMGAQSAVFAPVKYSILPQHLHRAELLGANGLVQGSTVLAIIFGTILGTELILTDSGVAVVSVLVVAVAVAGFVASLFVPPAPALGAKQGVDWLFPRAIWQLVRLALDHVAARRAILSSILFERVFEALRRCANTMRAQRISRGVEVPGVE